MNPSTQSLPLRDIHLPDPVSWWPPALGWWLLLVLAGIIAVSVFYLYRRYQRGALQRGAQRALQEIAAQWRHSGDSQALAGDLSILLRRLCLSRYPREQVAGLTGNAWLEQLDTLLPDNEFQGGVGRTLIEAPYTRNIHVDGDALLQLCERWVNNATRMQGARR
jgi:hypothetical protein